MSKIEFSTVLVILLCLVGMQITKGWDGDISFLLGVISILILKNAQPYLAEFFNIK